jgi:hypothetical protein
MADATVGDRAESLLEVLMKGRPFVSMVLAALVVWCGGDRPVMAWGNDGHQIVCAIAYKLLSPPSQQEVDRLTRLYRTPDNGRYQFFTAACTFPDLARTKASSDHLPTAQRWRHFAPFEKWHFLNLARTDRTVRDEVCNDNCVLHGMQRHLGDLRTHSLPDAQRAEALIFLGHWVGDVHQPLHVSYQDDRGGNAIEPVTGFYSPLGNLHSVWDSGIVGKAHPQVDWWTFAGQLHARITPALREQWVAVPMTQWAQESYDATTRAETLYCRWSANQCRAIAGGRHLTVSYQKAFGGLVERRLEQAGARLAAFIEQALGSP